VTVVPTSESELAGSITARQTRSPGEWNSSHGPTLKVKAIAEAKIKTDKIDATTLAHLLRCDLVPPAHACSLAARILKKRDWA